MIAAIVLAIALASGPATAAELPTAQHEFRECVAQQESRDNYKGKNQTSSAQGRYQFLDSKWRHGLAHMVAVSLRKNGVDWPTAKQIRGNLRNTPIKNWEPVYQDVGFAVALNANGPWSGWRHWYLPGSRCNGLVP